MTTNGCTYEEARKQRIEENKKRFQDLGITEISKSLKEVANSEKKTQRHLSKPKAMDICTLELRRSSRARNPSPSYRDDIDIADLPSLRKRSRMSSSSWGSYLARPIEEVKAASYEERIAALKAAEKLQSNLQSENPSFVKSMVRSHVYSCFWLGLPTKFCENHLPASVVHMELEDETGKEYEAIYIGKRTGLSGGWRAFALEHKLDDGDAVVFELVEPTRFKVYIVRASTVSTHESQEGMTKEENIVSTKKKSMLQKPELKSNQMKKSKKSTKLKKDDNTELKEDTSPTKNDQVSQKPKMKGKAGKANDSNEIDSTEEDKDKSVPRKSRRKLAPKLFRKKA